MTSKINPLIEFYLQCYQQDKRGVVLSDLFKLAKSDRHVFTEEDWITSARLPRIPVPLDFAQKLNMKSTQYAREKEIIYASIFICGQNKNKTTFGRTSKICAPLYYQKAKILFEQDDAYIVPTSKIEINSEILNDLIIDNQTTDDFPSSNNAISDLSAQVSWLKENTEIINPLEALYFPKLHNESQLNQGYQSKQLHIVSISAVCLAEKSKASRGLIHELNHIKHRSILNCAIDAVINDSVQQETHKNQYENTLPVILSTPQLRALKHATHKNNSIIFGPPGTGKSFTLASLITQSIINQQRVLVVAENEQALQVIAQKLSHTFNLTDGIVRAGQSEYLSQLKIYIDNLLTKGSEPADKNKLTQCHVQLQQVIHDQKEQQCLFEKISQHSIDWGRLYVKLDTNPSIINKLKLNFFNLMHSSHKQSAHQILDQIFNLQRQRQKLAKDFTRLTREYEISILLNNQPDALANFNRSIRSRSSSKQKEYFENIDFKALLTAFPVWLVSLDSLYKVLPLTKGLFDLAIFDEGSQISFAKAIPALFRAKRSVIAGDTKQLRHVTFLSKNDESKIFENLPKLQTPLDEISYRNNSLLDIALHTSHKQATSVLLDEHFRSKADLIHFSNHSFYQNQLKIMQHRPNIQEKNLTFTQVDGKREPNGTNKQEIQAIIDTLNGYIQQYKQNTIKPSIGIISPYSKQVIQIEKAIHKLGLNEPLKAFNILIGTPYHFQGEERDIILLSFVVDIHSQRAASYLNKSDMFNVAITRARQVQNVFYSIDATELNSNNLLRRYIEFTHVKPNKIEKDKHVCQFQDALSHSLNSLNIEHWNDYPIANQHIDILCYNQSSQSKNNQYLAIDLVGFPGSFEAYYDMDTYLLFQRLNIPILPISYKEWIKDKQQFLDLIRLKLAVFFSD